jgi:hypothetical protein
MVFVFGQRQYGSGIMINLSPITQGERGIITFTWQFPANLTSPATIQGAAISGVATNLDTGTITAITGALTGTNATTVTWQLSDGDSGTPGTYSIIFKAIVTGVDTYTAAASLVIVANPAATAVQNPPLFSVTSAQRSGLDAANNLSGANPAATMADVDAVEDDLTAHTGATGAGIHGAGATGAGVLGADTVDDARSELGLAATISPHRVQEAGLWTFSAVDVMGSATGSTGASKMIDMRTNETANSRMRYHVATTGTDYIRTNSPRDFVDWSRPVAFEVLARRSTATSDGTFRVIWGKISTEPYGIVASGNYIAIELVRSSGNLVLQSLILVKGGVIATVAVPSNPLVGAAGAKLFVESNNGNVKLYHDNILVAESDSGPVANSVVRGTVAYEIEKGDTPSGELRIMINSRVIG